MFSRPTLQFGGLIIIGFLVFRWWDNSGFFGRHSRLSPYDSPPSHAASVISRCQALTQPVGILEDFYRRSQSDRFEPGTKPVLIKDAKIWTGGRNGTEVVRGDILLDKGLIKSMGRLLPTVLDTYDSKLKVVDAKGAWVTPGIVDIHSHLGDASSPELQGAIDDNSLKGTIQPWMRSLDGLNTHDESYALSIAGGVTTSLILPGSANAIGGQAFVIKLRQTAERTPTSMLVEPPHQINMSFPSPNLPQRWRHMKHACGENPSDVYNDTRMDTAWAFRKAYETAREIKERQDAYCAKAIAGHWDKLGEFPDNYQWEALVDVLRGRVKVNAHCYEAVDLDGLVRLSNEFKFPIAAVHHASEAYLVPDLLKGAHEGTPAVALFATQGRYKREAYRASEFAPRILARHGLKVVMKSDHPVLNSRYLLYEAQQAYYYGFPYNLAFTSVTSASAEVMGMAHRIGEIREGYDADVVIWDSHPLALGATPSQVFIDGIPQLPKGPVIKKPSIFQYLPEIPDFDEEAALAEEYDGLPPLEPSKLRKTTVVFKNIQSIYKRVSGAIEPLFLAQNSSDFGVAVVEDGKLICTGQMAACMTNLNLDQIEVSTVDLQGGSLSPGLLSFGSPLGLQHIDQEPSTTDGMVFDPLERAIPKPLGGDTFIAHASDGLQFASRDAYLAYRTGVTRAVTAPSHAYFYAGLGTAFSTGARHKLEKGAIIKETTSVHVSVRHNDGGPSVSTQIAALRRLLFGDIKGSVGNWFEEIREGEIPLVIEAHNADIIATLIVLKKEIEFETRRLMKMTITGAAEAHLLAKELAEAGVGVILNPARPFPATWDARRILPGPPITKESSVMKLVAAGVTVGLGCQEIWEARNLVFDLGWVAIESGGKISKAEAFALGSTNLERLLGVDSNEEYADMVATSGGDLLDTKSKVKAIVSPGIGVFLV